jgi:hypothetical protein
MNWGRLLMLTKLRLYWDTLRHMRVQQLGYMLWYRAIVPRVTRLGTPDAGGVRVLQLYRPVVRRSHETDQEVDQFVSGARFLNHWVAFQERRPDWRASDQAKLWRYNLHYFDYLLWPGLSGVRKKELIDSWIESNPVGCADAWEPYTVSLRLVNWVKFIVAEVRVTEIPTKWEASLALQAAWLARRMEKHILGNHYLKNAKAILFAGAFFAGKLAGVWRQSGQAIFSEQMSEQFLGDGAHFERSPMYHCICTEDLLDVVNLGVSNPGLFEASFLQHVEDVSRRALDHLSRILMPDGSIPLFKDSAFGISPTPEDLFEYAERLMGYERPLSGLRGSPEAGFFMLGDAQDRVAVVCSPVSPPYQPGHTHCDMLSFELVLNGRRIIVDTGVYDYENSGERTYCRSTRAHNTACVDQEEQSEIWGVFRVARRARVVRAAWRELGAEGAEFEGEIEGFPRIPGKIRHLRRIRYLPGSGFSIMDRISGRGAHLVDVRLHLHPTAFAEFEDASFRISDRDGRRIATVAFDQGWEPRIESGWYFPEFGRKYENLVMRLSKRTELPAELICTITKWP